MKKTILTVALLSALQTPVLAQTNTSAADRIAAARARAEAAGVPADLLDLRVSEGRAKGIPEARIAQAVELRSEGLVRARTALERGAEEPSAAEIAAGADALSAGATGAAIRSVAQSARSEDRAIALAVLGELVKQGIPVERAAERVSQALAARDGSLAQLPAHAAAARARAGRPANAGRPGHVGQRPAGVGGPPPGVPGAGKKPPTMPGKPSGTPTGKPSGTPGGRPGGTP